jgi:peptidoglycan/LPS O-acetylase OafA/YrhL
MVNSFPEKRLPRVESLTGLRWFAALFVFAHHMTNLAPLPIYKILQFGTTGVTFFFVLSGFVLTWSSSTSTTTGTFYWRRFARIWPTHLVALLIALPVFYAVTPQPGEWWVKQWNLPVILSTVVMLQAWFSNSTILFAGNPASWTLSVEAFFYAFHPFVNRGVQKLRLRSALAFTAVVICVSFMMRIMIVKFGHPMISSKLSLLPVERSLEFLLGMGLAATLRSGWRVRLPNWLVLGFIPLSWFALDWASHHPNITGMARVGQCANEILAVIYALAIVAVASRDLDGRPSWLRSKPLVSLGQWSYSFYLVHATIIYTARAALGGHIAGWNNLGWYVLMLGPSILAAWLLYWFVEHPLEMRLRQWQNDRLSVRPTVASLLKKVV